MMLSTDPNDRATAPLFSTAPLGDPAPLPRAELRDPAVTIRFMLAGNAHVTFQSMRTDVHFTYRVRTADGMGAASHFVGVLTGPDDYEYLGVLIGEKTFVHGKKSRVSPAAPSAKAFKWCWAKLAAGKMPTDLAVYHEGCCGKCGRRLSDPESCRIGIGPTCRGQR
jgi:hypothetical protein